MAKRFEITLKVKAKHGKIYNYMIDNNLTLAQMCELLKISKSTISNMLNFRWKPSWKTTKTTEKLCKFFKCSIKELFPSELIKQLNWNEELRKTLQTTNIIRKEIDLQYLPFYAVPQLSYTPDFDKFELTDGINKLLHTLTPREEDIVRMVFFEDRTLEELAKKYKITRERVRQIEARAIRKLRRPERAKYLKPFFDSEEELSSEEDEGSLSKPKSVRLATP